MLESIGAFCAVRFTEVVHILEGPLREVPLYINHNQKYASGLVTITCVNLGFVQKHDQILNEFSRLLIQHIQDIIQLSFLL